MILKPSKWEEEEEENKVEVEGGATVEEGGVGALPLGEEGMGWDRYTTAATTAAVLPMRQDRPRQNTRMRMATPTSTTSSGPVEVTVGLMKAARAGVAVRLPSRMMTCPRPLPKRANGGAMQT
jgi:hypothetical protein